MSVTFNHGATLCAGARRPYANALARIRAACGVALLGLASALMPASADEAGAPKEIASLDEMANKFAETCLAKVFSGSDLHARFDDHPRIALRYNDQKAADFLMGRSGAVWGLRGHASNYALALFDNGICTIKAQSQVDGAWDDFDKLLLMLFPKAELVPVDQELAGPSADRVSSKGYRLRIQGRVIPQPIFAITRSTDPRLNFAVSMTVFGKVDIPPSGAPIQQ